jgi:hypothetical protein
MELVQWRGEYIPLCHAHFLVANRLGVVNVDEAEGSLT